MIKKCAHILTLLSFKIKNYPCISFNEDIFNYGNRKRDSIWVQIESLLAEKAGYKHTP